MNDFNKIRVEDHLDGGVKRIILDSPKGNVLDSEMMSEITSVLDEAKSLHRLKLIVYEGAGKHFCFGASVEEHTKENAPKMLEQFHGLFYRMIDLGVPTACLVRGQCLGGGMELAIYCDFVFAEPTAAFGQPEIMLGVLPPPASILLPLRIGQAGADEIVLTGATVDARRAFEMGIVNYLVPEGKDGWEHVSGWIGENIRKKSASSLRHARSCVRMHFNEQVKKHLPEIQKIYLEKLMATDDANEGIQAFLEKRKPAFKDR